MGENGTSVEQQVGSELDVVVVTGPADGRSGIGDYTRDLAGEMSDARIEEVVLPMDSNDPLAFAKRALRAGSTDADVIHVQHEYGMFGVATAMSWVFFPLLYVLAAWRHVPVVITIHEGLNEGMIRGRLQWAKRVYLALLNRLIVLNAARVMFLSETTAEEFGQSVPLASYTIVPHGASDEPFVDLDRSAAKRQLGYDPEQVLVSQPGYVEPRKGSHRMVDLAARMDEYEFLLAGGPAKEAYEGYFQDIVARAPPNLTVTGFLDQQDFHASFAASDLVVLSHQQTEQGGILNTVNQSGIFNYCATYDAPVIASDLPYFRTLEERWGCLQLCDFEDLDAAEEAVRGLVDDEAERARLSERIRAYAEAHSFTEVAKEHRRIYQNVEHRV